MRFLKEISWIGSKEESSGLVRSLENHFVARLHIDAGDD